MPTLDLKKVINILRERSGRTLRAEEIQSLCSILKNSLAYELDPAASTSRLLFPLPEGYSYRNQMWQHFKTCPVCKVVLRQLYEESKTLNINISTESNDSNPRGTLMCEIKRVPWDYQNRVRPTTPEAVSPYTQPLPSTTTDWTAAYTARALGATSMRIGSEPRTPTRLELQIQRMRAARPGDAPFNALIQSLESEALQQETSQEEDDNNE